MSSDQFTNSAGVTMTVEWRVPFGQTRSLTMALHSLAADTQTTPGCLGCSVSTDLIDGVVVRYAEEWKTEPDLRDRVRSAGFLRLMVLLETAIETPSVEFRLRDEVRGLDYVADVRRTRA